MFQSIRLQIFVPLLIVCYQMSLMNTATVNSGESALDLILLHNNDLHGRFDESSIIRTDCRPDEARNNKCFGGFARISTLVKQYRNAEQNENGPPVLYLNAGDTYTGTAWFFLFRDEIAAELMNALKPDVGALGNHEFDYGVSGLLPFLTAVNYPIAVANLNITEDHPLWRTHALQRSVVFNVKGFKIGVIGYILPETKNKTRVDDVEFSPEIEAINDEAAELTKNGVNIIIALGHSGYPKDQEIARECPLVDVVVGAHTHSFLYTGTPPEPDEVVGPYPTIVVQKSGKKVPVVQAYAYSKYMGKLELSFDKAGNLLRWSGLPILLDNQIPQDPEILQMLEKYRPDVEFLTKDIAGTAKVELSNDCMFSECNFGNLITDAGVYSHAKDYDGTGWTDASISIINSGGIRESVAIGNVSRFMLTTVLPFGNTLMVIHVPGHVLKAALERSVELYGMTEVKPFLQMSGIHVVYNVKKPIGNRVESVEVLCSNCTLPVYEELDLNRMYGIIIDSFLYSGGDGYTMFKPYKPQHMDLTSFNSTYDHIKRLQLLYTAIDGRIKFAEGSDRITFAGTSHATSIILAPSISIALIAFSLIFCQLSFNCCSI